MRAQIDGNNSGAQGDSIDDGHEDEDDDDDDDDDTVFVSREYGMLPDNHRADITLSSYQQ